MVEIVKWMVGSLLIFLAPLGHASYMGQEVRLDQVYPDAETVPYSAGTAVVGGGVEFPSTIADYDWDLSSNHIRFYWGSPCPLLECPISYTPSDFNGFRLVGLGASFPRIVGVGISAFSGFDTFDPWRVSFDDVSVFINLGGLSAIYSSESRVGATLRVVFERANKVSEPSTLPLLLTGLLAFLALSRAARPHCKKL